MTLSVSFLLVPYFLLLGVFFVFAVIHVWHLVKYAPIEGKALVMLLFLIGAIVVILAVTGRYALSIDWDAEVELFRFGGGDVFPLTF